MVSKKKVVIILNRIVIGGQATDTIPMAYFLKNNFDITIICGVKEKDETYANQLLKKYNDLKIIQLNTLKRSINPLIDIYCFFQINKILLRIRPHIVHTHGAKPGLIGRLSAKLMSVPGIIHTYHGHHFHSYFNKFISSLYIFIEKKLAKISSAIIVLSKKQFEEIVEKFKISSTHKTKLIPLGVEFEKESDTEEQVELLNKKFKISENEIKIGIIGRLVPIKNISFFIKIASVIIDANYSVKFFIVGDGNEMDKIKSEIKKHGFSFCEKLNSYENEPFILTSWQEEIKPWIYFLDIVLSTSINEGTPFSLIEAQIAGKPVIATNVGGVADTIRNNSTGFLIPLSNKDIFVEKIIELVENSALRKEMGLRGTQWANEQFSKEKEVQNIEKLYNSLLEENNNK